MSKQHETYEMFDTSPEKRSRGKLIGLFLLFVLAAGGALAYFVTDNKKEVKIASESNALMAKADSTKPPPEKAIENTTPTAAPLQLTKEPTKPSDKSISKEPGTETSVPRVEPGKTPADIATETKPPITASASTDGGPMQSPDSKLTTKVDSSVEVVPGKEHDKSSAQPSEQVRSAAMPTEKGPGQSVAEKPVKIMDQGTVGSAGSESAQLALQKSPQSFAAPSVAPSVSPAYEEIHFAFDKDEPLPSEIERLQAFWATASRTPGDLIVEGHSDGIGSGNYNQALSTRRAENTARMLRKLGMDARYKVVIRGMGKSDPIGSNSTLDGRALNRRVALSFVPAK